MHWACNKYAYHW